MLLLCSLAGAQCESRWFLETPLYPEDQLDFYGVVQPYYERELAKHHRICTALFDQGEGWQHKIMFRPDGQRLWHTYVGGVFNDSIVYHYDDQGRYTGRTHFDHIGESGSRRIEYSRFQLTPQIFAERVRTFEEGRKLYTTYDLILSTCRHYVRYRRSQVNPETDPEKVPMELEKRMRYEAATNTVTSFNTNTRIVYERVITFDEGGYPIKRQDFSPRGKVLMRTTEWTNDAQGRVIREVFTGGPYYADRPQMVSEYEFNFSWETNPQESLIGLIHLREDGLIKEYTSRAEPDDAPTTCTYTFYPE